MNIHVLETPFFLPLLLLTLKKKKKKDPAGGENTAAWEGEVGGREERVNWTTWGRTASQVDTTLRQAASFLTLREQTFPLVRGAGVQVCAEVPTALSCRADL